jgi:hypothetical protein
MLNTRKKKVNFYTTSNLLLIRRFSGTIFATKNEKANIKIVQTCLKTRITQMQGA